MQKQIRKQPIKLRCPGCDADLTLKMLNYSEERIENFGNFVVSSKTKIGWCVDCGIPLAFDSV